MNNIKVLIVVLIILEALISIFILRDLSRRIDTEVYAKNRKKGYLDINVGIAAPLDSPNYF